jgi:serine-type D-Ala-D-Ala carboxypeptidase/endopeptidase
LNFNQLQIFLPVKITFISVLIFISSPLFAQNGGALKHVIDQLMRRETRVDSAKVTGFVIGCMDGDSTWIFPYGRLSKTTKEAPNGDTYFEIGGVSQVFIAHRIHELVETKQLDYAAPINQYLPPSLQFPMGARMTLLQLTTHTSGLPKLPDDIGAFEAEKEQPFEVYTEGSLFEYLKTFDTTRLTVGTYRYAPLNYAILEKILEKKEFLNFEKDSFPNKSFAQGYNLAQKPVELGRFNETFQWTLGRQMTVKQLMNFVQKQLTVNELHKPLYPTNIGKFTSMGKAWHVIKENKRINICVATGTTAGHSAFVAFVPETKTAVVILTNSRLIAGKMGLAILRTLNENWKRK